MAVRRKKKYKGIKNSVPKLPPIKKRQAVKPKVKVTKRLKPKQYPYKLSSMNPRSPKHLPETVLTKKGKTLRQMMRHTMHFYRLGSKEVVVKRIKVTKTRSGLPAVTATMLTVDTYRPNRVPRPHECVIIGLDPDQPLVNKNRKVLISCNCESYVYTFEYANAYYGAGRIIYCNGDKPVYTNPDLQPGNCKHVYALSEHIVSKNL